MKRVAALGFVALVGVSACGDDTTPAERALLDAADATAEVRAGELRLRVAATPPDGADVGFSVEGPFALATEEGALPEVRFTYTDLLGGRTRRSVFASTADGVEATVDGRAVTVSDDAVTHLRGKAGDSEEGLPRLALDEWAHRPRLVDGAVEAEVDVARALPGVVALATAVGAQPRQMAPLEGDAAERLAAAVRSSRLRAVIGDDDVLRTLRMEMVFGPDADEDADAGTGTGARRTVAEAFGRLAGLRLVVEVDLELRRR